MVKIAKTSRQEASYGQRYPCPTLYSFWVEVGQPARLALDPASQALEPASQASEPAAQLQPKNCIKWGKGTADHMMPLGDWLGLRALLGPQKTGQNMLKLTRSSFVHAQTVVRGHHGCKSFMEHPCHVNLFLCIRVVHMSHL